ncbi:Peroxin/Dysferlin domain-containing protein [Chlamydoabsidia padenii]|nr:Peroxin/Dysferlin domain-containing protein [Chlamydoabsidia padenii]
MVKHQETSYSSPYSIGTLDNIPPPILRLLVSLGPLLHTIRQATDIIQWQSSSPRQSILALLLWNLVCLWTRPTLALGLPGVVFYKLFTDWLQFRTSRTRRERLERARCQQLEKQQPHDTDHEDDERLTSLRLLQQHEAEQEELIARKIQPEGQVSLDDTLENVSAIVQFIHRLVAIQRTVLDRYLDGTRPEVLVATLGGMVYIVPIWWVVVYWLGSQGTLALLGSFGLVAYSPWTLVLVLAVRRQPLLRYVVVVLWSYSVALVSSWRAFDFLGTNKTTTSIKPWKKWWSYIWHRAAHEKQAMTADDMQTPTKSTRNEMVFQFEIYENQRWWLGANWTTNMLSTERGPWTDNQLAPITSKEDFKLPPATEKTDGKQVTRKSWSWADNDWWVDMTGELDGKVDYSGWEYGNNAWQNMTGLPAIQTFTRRRRWCRRALLIEQRQQPVDDTTNGLRKRT